MCSVRQREVEIEDRNVLNFWMCEECGEIDSITPDWYEDNGTPTCCDRDAVYLYTKIILEEKE